VASDGTGNLYVIDTGNHTLRKIVVATGLVTTVAGSAGEKGSVDGIGAAARFLELNAIASDGAGNLFVSDGDSLRQVRVATGEVTTLAGASEDRGSLDGMGTAARFDGPRGLLYDAAGLLFVADFNNGIRKVVVATGQVSTLTLSADEGANADGGVHAVLKGPCALATDGAGHLFVSEQSGQTVRQVVLATGKVTTLAGQRDGLVGFADGIGEAARFRYPMGMVSDGAGGLLVADYGNHVIRKLDIATREVTTVIGDPRQNGLALSPLRPILSGPIGLALGPSGQLFLTDRAQNVVLVAEL
jgi:DNA-binding beta-propeller fold protein YncE